MTTIMTPRERYFEQNTTSQPKRGKDHRATQKTHW